MKTTVEKISVTTYYAVNHKDVEYTVIENYDINSDSANHETLAVSGEQPDRTVENEILAAIDKFTDAE